MTNLIFQGFTALCICVCSTISSKQSYHYPSLASGSSAFNESPTPVSPITGLDVATGPGPIGPTGLGPNTYGGMSESFGFGHFPFLGHYGHAPFFPPHPFHPLSKFGPHEFHLLALLKEKLPSFLESLAFAIISAVLVSCFQTILLPHFGVYVALMGRALQETDPRALDVLSRSVRQAITKGACLDRIACHLGRRANKHSVSPTVLKVLQSLETPNSTLEIFRLSASGEIASCKEYSCWYADRRYPDDLSPYKRDIPNANEI